MAQFPGSRRRTCLRIEPLEERMLLTAGALDTTYGGTGQVITALSYDYLPEGLAVQSDLKTVVVGMENSNLNTKYPFYNYPYNTSIVRYNQDGSLDASFGTGGVVSLPTTSISQDSVTIQADGKIVVATNTTTYTYHPQTRKAPASYTLTSSQMVVLRLNTNGSLDTSFGNAGEAVIPIPNAPFEYTGGVAVLPGGQIVVGGTNLGTNAGPEFVVARLTSSGVLDSTFGPGGQGYNDVTVSSGTTSQVNNVDTLGVDAAGNILIGGYTSNASGSTYFLQVARYTPGGLLDTTFANQGVFDLATPGATPVRAIAFQPDGHIIIGPVRSPAPVKPAILRLNSDGTIDTTFGSNGYFLTPGYAAWGIAVQPDGKILTTGTIQPNTVVTSRVLPGGTLDLTFGTGGTVTFVAQSPAVGVSIGLIIGPDGKITGLFQADTANQIPVIGTFRLLNDITTNTPALAPAAASLASAAPSSAGAITALTPDLVDAMFNSSGATTIGWTGKSRRGLRTSS